MRVNLKLFLTIIFLISSLTLASAQEEKKESVADNEAVTNVGKLKTFSGNVLMKKKSEVKNTKITNENEEIPENSTVRTKKESNAHIMLTDGSEIYMDERSIISFEDFKNISSDGGKVVFNIKKQGGAEGIKIALKTAVIGVKGTKFIVEVKDDEEQTTNVYLKEGKLGFEAIDGEFKKYKQVEIDEFEAFVRRQMGEYDQYVKELQEEYAEYVKGFDLDAGKAISISGNEVKEIELVADELEKLFDKLQ